MSKKLVSVPCCCGRLWLRVAGLFVAMQGDKCRDPELPDSGAGWDENSLHIAAERILAAIEERERAAWEAAREEDLMDEYAFSVHRWRTFDDWKREREAHGKAD